MSTNELPPQFSDPLDKETDFTFRSRHKKLEPPTETLGCTDEQSFYIEFGLYPRSPIELRFSTKNVVLGATEYTLLAGMDEAQPMRITRPVLGKVLPGKIGEEFDNTDVKLERLTMPGDTSDLVEPPQDTAVLFPDHVVWLHLFNDAGDIAGQSFDLLVGEELGSVTRQGEGKPPRVGWGILPGLGDRDRVKSIVKSRTNGVSPLREEHIEDGWHLMRVVYGDLCAVAVLLNLQLERVAFQVLFDTRIEIESVTSCERKPGFGNFKIRMHA